MADMIFTCLCLSREAHRAWEILKPKAFLNAIEIFHNGPRLLHFLISLRFSIAQNGSMCTFFLIYYVLQKKESFLPSQVVILNYKKLSDRQKI